MVNIKKDVTLNDLIDMVIAETEEPRDLVEEIVASFLLNFRDAVPTKIVFIRGIGTFCTEIKKRRYSDPYDKATIRHSVKPKIVFRPVSLFVDIVTEKRKSELVLHTTPV